MSIDQTKITGTFKTSDGGQATFSPSISLSVFRRVSIDYPSGVVSKFNIVEGRQDGVRGYGLSQTEDIVRWIGRTREDAVSYVLATY